MFVSDNRPILGARNICRVRHAAHIVLGSAEEQIRLFGAPCFQSRISRRIDCTSAFHIRANRASLFLEPLTGGGATNDSPMCLCPPDARCSTGSFENALSYRSHSSLGFINMWINHILVDKMLAAALAQVEKLPKRHLGRAQSFCIL